MTLDIGWTGIVSLIIFGLVFWALSFLGLDFIRHLGLSLVLAAPVVLVFGLLSRNLVRKFISAEKASETEEEQKLRELSGRETEKSTGFFSSANFVFMTFGLWALMSLIAGLVLLLL
jgi:uncharacterized membrane protein